jgi:hypothetical protein
VSDRLVHVVLLVAALALGVAVTKRSGSDLPERERRIHPLSLVPAGPVLLATLDLVRLRRSDAGLLFEQADLSGLFGRSKTCGFDPLRDLDLAVLSVAERSAETAEDAGASPDGDSASVALLATGRFAKATIVACAESRIRGRGGEPRRIGSGRFTIVRDPRALTEVATEDGLFAVSDGPYLKSILERAHGRETAGNETARLRDRMHVELRRTFGRGAPFMATSIVPGDFLSRSFGPEAARSPLASIRSAGLRVEPRERLVVGAFLGCATAPGCDDVAAFLDDTRRSLTPILDARLARILDGVKLEHEGQRIELSTELGPSELKTLGDALELPDDAAR